jgi:L-2-hydroxyglutarate oxidase LhgO
LGSSVTSIRPADGRLQVEIENDGESSMLSARWVINSAGLSAVELLHHIEGYPAESIPQAYFAKGSYFSCPGRPFRHLVYPMPNDAGLGIHATLDLDGSVRFGPDVEWVDDIEYSVDPGRVDSFREAIREYWPAVSSRQLQPAYSGIRPKIVAPGQRAADFVIAGPREHVVPGLVNLLGMESPGLTAALAIAEHIVCLQIAP